MIVEKKTKNMQGNTRKKYSKVTANISLLKTRVFKLKKRVKK